jgi:hypothetical protein
MTFDPELMRDVLLAIEAMPAGEPFDGVIQSGTHPQSETNEHVDLLIKNGFINGESLPDHRGVPIRFSILGLSLKGHEFLANARNNTVWKKVLAEAKSKGLSVSVTVINGLLEKAAQKYAGLGES